jgi:NADH-quinone oxidoreductase subunit H
MWMLIKVIIVISLLMLAVAYVTLAERKLLAFMQLRFGPNRVGWHGALQPIADGVKLLIKECIVPLEADKWLYRMAPVVSIAFALVPFAVVPFARAFYITDINIGLIFVMAVGSLGFLGTIMAGWSSGSKYSFLGSLRALALMISFEVPMVMSMVGVILFSRSLSLVSIVESQARWGWFVRLQPVAFIVYLLCGIAETQRIPFDMLEDEGSLVCGFFTEYSGMRFGLFFMAEYANMFMVAILATVLFLGGWQRPFASWPLFDFLAVVPSVVWFSLKVLAFMFLYFWLRATLPRVRYDQLMYLCWKILLPLTLINLMLTSLYLLLRMNILVFYLLNLVSVLAWLKAYGTTQAWAKAASQ